MAKDIDKKGRFKKPNPFVYYTCGSLIWLANKIFFKAEFDRSGIRDLKGPAIIMANHVSNLDFIYVGLTLFPIRPTFVVSQHFIENPISRFWLSSVHVIPKKMFCPDVRTVKNIIKAKNSGNIIVLFPEGRLAAYGHSQNLADGTAELVKKLGVPVYALCEDGGYKALPKWGKAGFRRGPVIVRTKKVFSGEELKTLDVETIDQRLNKAMLHDEDKTFIGREYKCRKPALGLDSILYKCPYCEKEFAMHADSHDIFCTDCGLKIRLTEKYELKMLGKKVSYTFPFKTINDWYFWQEQNLNLDEPMEMDCIVRTKDASGNKVDNGEGHISINREEIRFDGIVLGEPLSFVESTKKIRSFPVTCNDHFDLYSSGILYSIVPKGDRRVVMKWVSYMDKLNR